MECGVCFHVYDEDNRRPRSLGCGHTFCSSCTGEMIKPSKGLSCPTCRTVHDISKIVQVPVNYSLMEILKLLELSEENLEQRPKEEAENFPPPSAPSPENLPGDRCETHHQSWQYRCVPCNQWMCRDCMVIEHLDRGCRVISSKQALEEMMEQSKSEAKDRLSYYESRLTRMRQYDSELEMHLQKHESQLRGLVMMTERQHRFVKLIQEERERVGRAIRDGREAKRLLEVCILKSEAKSQEELTHALGNTQLCDARLQDWVSSCLVEFNPSSRKNRSIKQLLATASALHIISGCSEEPDKEASKGIYAVLDIAKNEQVRALLTKILSKKLTSRL
ncbi:Zinc finger C3HC4 RING-type [Trinorchestia longiramus]|nr:Zinc finger C3HC4 RING-type [Trinorchestia longiramus]